MRRNLIFFKIADIKGISKERPGGIPSHLWNSYKTEKHFYQNFQAASLDIFNIKTRWKGDSVSRKTPENRTCTAGPREAGRELGRGGNRKRSFQRPLVARGDLSKRAQGQEWGGGTPNPERGGGRGKKQLTYLVHVCSIFQALSLLAGRSSPRSGSSLGK